MSSSQAAKKNAKIKEAPPPLPSAIPAETQSFILLRSATAEKLGKKSKGSLSYQWLCDTSRQQLSLRIIGNDSSGYFSKEIVPFNRIEQCLQSQSDQKPFASVLLKTSFHGQSSNNSGFLAAILRAEKLTVAVPDSETLHQVSGNWKAWMHALLKLPGTPIEVTLSAAINKPLVAAAPCDPTGLANSITDDANADDANTSGDATTLADSSSQSDSDHTDQRKTLKLPKKSQIDLTKP
ncbi:MAG: hypothetical protein P4L91_06485 [Burkholderiaceae bacterium]|nr:hypothetical protein [Burkholderiaceae bacterium]